MKLLGRLSSRARFTRIGLAVRGLELTAFNSKWMYMAGGFDSRQPGTSREKALRFVVSWPWVLLQLFAIAVDAAALIGPVVARGVGEFWAAGGEPSVFHALKMVFLSLVYLADVALRIFGFGPKVFMTKWWNLFDAFIVLLTVANAVAVVTESAGGTGPFRFLRLLRVFRILRIIRIAFVVSRTFPRCWNRMRRITGENKRRFVSLEHDFDLDLVYITPRAQQRVLHAGRLDDAA
ncbi:Sodium channel protein type 11 subunit alpha (NaN) (Sensory neuron sodium channel 2) (Sodium channel protein type XI subunit alpha) (Voltage-gated sodium channel subunit alpha Nav1.9) [Durusdinium trenchii]|uniref:Sodium channel protein type 11 subunit alpha (NaN) (Sensory neuron sodium channel 2) (Sodium channel protein type XI subunit alpha) (Voltage-gated sodium channel subunit alpha Nav1.9) n=1 Tax=Durusdinium trenchii TaxID=1381693 RepID=A0ABP0SID5_9DINO